MDHGDLMVYKEITDGTGVQVPYFPEDCVCPATAWMNQVVRNNSVFVTREFLGIMIDSCHTIVRHVLQNMDPDIDMAGTCVTVMGNLCNRLRIPNQSTRMSMPLNLCFNLGMVPISNQLVILKKGTFRAEITSYMTNLLRVYRRRAREPRLPNYVGNLQIHVVLDQDKDQSNRDCPICMDEKEPVQLNCGHNFCVDCIEQSTCSRLKSFITCALCREEVHEVKVLNLATKTRFEDQILVRKVAR